MDLDSLRWRPRVKRTLFATCIERSTSAEKHRGLPRFDRRISLALTLISGVWLTWWLAVQSFPSSCMVHGC